MYHTIERLFRERNIPSQNVVYVNFEHERLRNLDATDLEEMMVVVHELMEEDPNYPMYLFLDEIQIVKDWQKWVNRMYEKKKFRIYISGSSSKLLSSELSSELRGRSLDFSVLPLSFKEYLDFTGRKLGDLKPLLRSEKRGEVLRFLKDYISMGGYPEVVLSREEGSRLLRSYADTMIIKDVGERFRIEPSVLRVFLEYLINNNAKYVSGSKIYNYLKSLNYRIGRDVPLRYLHYFREVFAIFPVEIFSFSFKSRKQYPKKVFSVDTGMVNVLQGKEDFGRLMENVVFLELFRRSNGQTNFSVNYWKEYGKSEGAEVDFVVTKKGMPVELINVTYASSESEIKKRETEALRKAGTELKCAKKTLITWDYYDRGNVVCEPLWYWLLHS